MATFYYETECVDPCLNLATEEYLLFHKREGNILMLWQNDNTVVIGCNQNAEAEINRQFVDEHRITVVRRITGGGAVYHDLGNLNFSLITGWEGEREDCLSRFLEPVVKALREMGAPAEINGRNDITVNGRKVSGNAQRLENGRILHHGTLLFDCDPDMIAGALNVDSSKYRSKGIQSVRSRVGGLREFLPGDTDIDTFKRALKESLLETEETVPMAITPAEFAQIEEIARSRYRSWEWTYGRSGEFSTVRRRRFSGGLLEVHLSMEKGRIRDVAFTGDFLALRDVDEAAKRLLGCRADRMDLENVLEEIPLSEYFGQIDKEEILQLLLGN